MSTDVEAPTVLRGRPHTRSTVMRVGPVLGLFTPERPTWRLVDIAAELGTPKSSIHGLLASLVEIGLLSQLPGRQYQLGWGILALGDRMRRGLDFRAPALTVMRRLAEATRETVLLTVLDRGQVVVLDSVDGRHPTVRLAPVRVGSTAPAHCSAAGKALLAHRPAPEIRALCSDIGMPRFTDRTLSSVGALEDELVRVRDRGYAVERGERTPDVSGLAAPIAAGFGDVVAAIAIAVPSSRLPAAPARLGRLLVDAAGTVTDALEAAGTARGTAARAAA